jgi:hypothetical protein
MAEAFYSDKASIFRAVRDSTDFGRGTTQFGRVLFELNRLVKELRLRGINTREAANAFAPHFIADFNARFAKAPLREFDAHRPVRADEDLDLLFTWRLQRKVSLSLTLQHDRVIYLLKDTPAIRKLIHRYIDVFEYPDGRIELRADGANLVYERYDRLPHVDTAAIVENKRLSHAPQAALVIQAQRDDRRKSNTPSRTNQGQAPYSTKALPGSHCVRRAPSRKKKCDISIWLAVRHLNLALTRGVGPK